MARDMDTDLVALFEGVKVDPIFLFAAYFDSGTLRFWTGLGEIVVDSETYYGAGNLISISKLEETSELRATSATFGLSGIPVEMMAVALAEPYQGRRAKCWIAALSNGALAVDPYLLHDAYMDVMEIEKGGQTATIRMNVETRRRKRSDAYYTDEDQKRRYASDNFFSRVAELQDREIVLKA